MTNFEKAVRYVQENRTWSDAEDAIALERINHYRCNINFASPQICMEITELMEEYGENNGLPEDWWRMFADEDEIFFQLN